ncbi:MAG: N-acetyl-gamma-glutamyl-phosphate reductase [Alphaproteobacteria bacterium]|jgi:N-acetyl-gamma-glutamyl-phosphate reductase|nr:N-acetyl-gamma-glutamyl-phosphate reductase [Alphaproteobacteria bacterium]
MTRGNKIQASIIGITGYTGLELLRLLLAHPKVEMKYLTSRQHVKEPIGKIYPHLAHLDLLVTNAAPEKVAKDSDVVFLCLPHKTAQDVVAALHGKTKIVDLSADFRLDDAATYKKYYEEHKYPALLKKVVYGAPEVGYTASIKKASTVANPGCFAFLGQLLLYPFKDNIKQADIFAVTGSSGAGKTPADGTHHPVRNHNMKSYNINKHRHIPEITRSAGITEKQLNFVPTSGPFTRGIFAQAFVTLKKKTDIAAAVKKAYGKAPFVRIQNEVALANIVGSNFVDLSFMEGTDGKILVQGALDNIVKGAGGSAVQNMNLMFGLKETEGLINLAPLYP